MEPEVQSYEFETRTFDATGAVVEQATGRARSVVETLGDGVTLVMTEIPSGAFVMGSPEQEGDRDERPQRRVDVQSFLIGKFMVTQDQWRAVAALDEVERTLDPDPSHYKGAALPVERIPWGDAIEFCARVSRATGRRYRLPSEAEWEYACRAGTTGPFAFGETIASVVVNYDANFPYGAGPRGLYRMKTTPVGSLGVANAWGLFDMHGNVWEWCEDVWHDSYEGAPVDASAWLDGGNQALRVLRGGSWDYVAHGCRSAFRDRGSPQIASPFNGLRVACDL